jgi:hypothetical protein
MGSVIAPFLIFVHQLNNYSMYMLYMDSFGDCKIVPTATIILDGNSSFGLLSGYLPVFEGSMEDCEWEGAKRKEEIINRQIVPALGDAELWDMFMKEYENPGYIDEED